MLQCYDWANNLVTSRRLRQLGESTLHIMCENVDKIKKNTKASYFLYYFSSKMRWNTFSFSVILCFYVVMESKCTVSITPYRYIKFNLCAIQFHGLTMNISPCKTWTDYVTCVRKEFRSDTGSSWLWNNKLYLLSTSGYEKFLVRNLVPCAQVNHLFFSTDSFGRNPKEHLYVTTL